MTILSLFSGRYAGSESILEAFRQKTHSRLFRDADIIAICAKQHDIRPTVLEKALYDKASVFNTFTHEKERAVACLKATLADMLETEAQIFTGHTALLFPPSVTHVLRVLLIADQNWRLEQAKSRGIAEKEALKEIRQTDENAFIWAKHIWDKSPWDAARYDMVLPMDKTADPLARILEQMDNPAVQITDISRRAMEDFRLAARVELALASEGHSVSVSASSGKVRITIEKKVTLLSMLEKELQRIASSVEGVREVETCIGQKFHQADIYRKYDFDMSYKVLLVDDEQEFVQTLSERLRMRDVPSHAVYSGEEALGLLEEETPEVMVLDLKMPGVDGFEILAKVKKTNPDIEVIILTGHGTENDRQRCMEMGAFAYLQKPTDIDLLTTTMKKAYARIREKRNLSL